MKNVFAFVGVVVLFVGVLGLLGIDHFSITYSVAPQSCMKATT
ncbi:hypothetical protein [Burkholderia pseudomallei]|nr:hypothetical protein [Burkholderia pseudomallei]EDO95270.1 hypothetical protein BURPSPAST_M0061 [Burkholderia pseudomallei Pasteur 52237]